MRYIKSFIERNRDNLRLFLRINRLLFLIATFVYLLLLIMNLLLDKYFEEYINIYVIFIILLISGIFFRDCVIFEEIEKVNIKRNLERKDIFLFLIIGLICSALVWMKIKDFGTISYIISIISGLLILTLSILLFY